MTMLANDSRRSRNHYWSRRPTDGRGAGCEADGSAVASGGGWVAEVSGACWVAEVSATGDVPAMSGGSVRSQGLIRY
jgi:hypothetical protein